MNACLVLYPSGFDRYLSLMKGDTEALDSMKQLYTSYTTNPSSVDKQELIIYVRAVLKKISYNLVK